MKRTILTLVAAVAGVCAGMMLRECERPKPMEYRPPGETVIDTVTYVDTIPYILPTPAKETANGTKIVYLPVPAFSIGNNDSTNIPPICNIEGENILPDSVAVEIPITQREYEGKDYHAWVSGYEPSLDSIYVFARHDVVTIREPSLRSDHNGNKRLGIGLFAGYGYTPQGFQPCAGISINYNLWNF